MHRLLTLAAVVIFTAQSAWALSCAQPRPIFWPNDATLPAQPFIVLDNEILKTAWFQAGEARVDASVTQVGGFQIIRPKAPLTVGVTYTLGGTGANRFVKGPWHWVDNKQAPVTWTIQADKAAAPTWKNTIKVGEGTARKGGWGPTSSQILHLDFASDGPVIAEVALVRGATSKTLLLPAQPGKPLRFGQGLCDGDVQLIGPGVWTANVTLISASGQRSKTQTAYFTTPIPTGY